MAGPSDSYADAQGGLHCAGWRGESAFASAEVQDHGEGAAGDCEWVGYSTTLHSTNGPFCFSGGWHAAADYDRRPVHLNVVNDLCAVYPAAFLDLPSYVDGIAEFVPGITPYRWNYGMPAKAVELVYGGDKSLAAKCPIWRRCGNVENLTVAASEYTVWETIAPAASVCGYLLAPTGTPPPVRPAPAKDVRDLPGYWTMP